MATTSPPTSTIKISGDLPCFDLAAKYFEHWPENLTDAESNLRQQLQAYASLGAPLHLYLLHRAKVFKAAALPASVSKMRPRECYRNAAKLAQAHPDKLVYVEGYAQAVIAVSHAWCVTRNGTVVDPTWKNPAECAYLGVPICGTSLTAQLLKQKVWGLFGDMPQIAVLRSPVSNMVHPWWRAEIASRPSWPKLETFMRDVVRSSD